MPNQTLKDRIRKSGLKLWEVAYALGMTDGNFSRLLRVELSDEKRQQIEKAVLELIEEKGKNEAQYIDKATSSVRNQQRAYGATQGIQQLPAEKVVDKEQFNRAANEIGESDEWTDSDKMMLAVFVNSLEERLFGGAE